MKILFDAADFKKIKADALVYFCENKKFPGDPVLKGIDDALGGTVRELFLSGEFEGKPGQTAIIHTHGKIPSGRIVLGGLGGGELPEHERFRRAAGELSGEAGIKKSKKVAFFLPNDTAEEKIVSAIVQGFLLGGFTIREYKTDNGDNHSLTGILHFYAANKRPLGAIRKGAQFGLISAEGTILARRLAADPSNNLTPRIFADKAKKLAVEHRIKFRVLDENNIKKEKMGALLAVAKGSDEPPRFVILDYRGGRTGSKPIVLVGKGITFDSGGLSLKQPQLMVEMKGDMTGGAVVLAALVTAARLGIKQNIIGLIPLAENMPSGRATRPGDIVTSRKGKTIEILNTDAEGRLILADALDYANKFRPQAVIDIATLTGAALYILGYEGAPITGNNDKLIEAIRKASERSAERVWPLPIWDEYREWMKSPLADLKNSGGKPAATLTAAAFLENFIGDWPWAHIDIAYVDVEKEGRSYIPKGTTGFGVRLLTELLSEWKSL